MAVLSTCYVPGTILGLNKKSLQFSQCRQLAFLTLRYVPNLVIYHCLTNSSKTQRFKAINILLFLMILSLIWG